MARNTNRGGGLAFFDVIEANNLKLRDGVIGNLVVGDQDVRDRIDLLFLNAHAAYYHEVTYNADKYKTQVDVWTSAAKTTKLFTMTYTYNSSNYMTAFSITDEVNTKTLTKAWTYDSDNYVISFTKAYT